MNPANWVIAKQNLYLSPMLGLQYLRREKQTLINLTNARIAFCLKLTCKCYREPKELENMLICILIFDFEI